MNDCMGMCTWCSPAQSTILRNELTLARSQIIIWIIAGAAVAMVGIVLIIASSFISTQKNGSCTALAQQDAINPIEPKCQWCSHPLPKPLPERCPHCAGLLR
jgi:hypothetical protein